MIFAWARRVTTAALDAGRPHPVGERREPLEAELLGTRVRLDTRRGERRVGLVAVEAEPAQRVAHGLAAFREGTVDDAPERTLVGRDRWRLEPIEPHDDRVDLGTRPEHGARHPAHDRRGRAVGHAQARRAEVLVGRARRRAARPTSRCTITTQRSIAGTSASVSSTSGTAMLYGRFAQSVHVPASPSAARPVEPHRVGLQHAHRWQAGGRFLERRHEPAVELHGDAPIAPAAASATVSDPRPAPISTTRSPEPTPASADDGPREVRVDQEVLAERLRRADAVAGRELSDRRRAERRRPRRPHQAMVTSRTPAPSGWRTANASGERSMILPVPNGPRSSIVTVTERPVSVSVTVTSVPNGSVGWAAVSPDHGGSYQVARPAWVSSTAPGHVGGAGVHRLGRRQHAAR